MLVKSGQRYGYDLIVHVGLSRYLEGKQKEKIRTYLLHERSMLRQPLFDAVGFFGS